ncbi:hypothetical protein BU17DRAFT_68183 [Hysterangium stoloniferum]|nr:hypothetical protein BU17DRAFT_68183 [Hysterangium stoloniferum]
MSKQGKFSHFSPPPHNTHSPPTNSAPSLSLPFMLGLPKLQSHRRSNPRPSDVNQSSEDDLYAAKYKEMKRKVKEIEEINDRLHLKCLKVRKSILRLRVERAILYERLSVISKPSNIPLLNAEQLPAISPNQCSEDGQNQGNGPHSAPEVQARRQYMPQSQKTSPHLRSSFRGDIQTTPRILGENEHPHGHHGLHQRALDPYQPPESVLPDKQLLKKPKKNVDTKGSQAGSSYQEIKNGNFMKTFPFVLEYSVNQKQSEQGLSPSDYPTEIKFQQYEGFPERQPARSKKDIERDEKGGRQKRRGQQQIVNSQVYNDPAQRRISPRCTDSFAIQNQPAIGRKFRHSPPYDEGTRYTGNTDLNGSVYIEDIIPVARQPYGLLAFDKQHTQLKVGRSNQTVDMADQPDDGSNSEEA